MSGLPLLVAAGQAEARSAAEPGGIEANVATAVALLDEAVGRRARLLVLPEAFLTGYDERVFPSAQVPAPHDLPDLLRPLSEAARAAEAVVVLSSPLRRGDLTTMTMLVVQPDGTVAAPYDKQHLDADERRFLVAGDHGASIGVDDHELGLAICYDSSFPEHARHAADAGSIGYLVSGAFFPGSERRRDTALAARALDNTMYVVAACATGTTGAQSFVGGSSIWGPEGEPLARLDTEEGVVVAAVDPRELAVVRTRRTLAADRRTDLGGRETRPTS